ncbi:AraC-like DNA-binding protein [Microbacterium sp. AK009]|uniref:AraC family transcriptional regulator n=1 Tax=Microbacterium sp. AK009 TaxID=2723068 RepID=UPI0015C76D2E|nr:helix-turn-helix domain-containing protein [Microbacterium sp. AK009]NYF18160.1 AraC-like DNA-binding protein [Microbacterium sp. AK009]
MRFWGVYQLAHPAPALQPYIENYWFVSHGPGEEVELRVDVFVDARADLIFNFEAPYVREVIGGKSRQIAESTLDLQRLVPIRIHQQGFVRIVGVRFRLGGLAPFARDDLKRWNGGTPAPTLVLGDAVAELEDRLRNEEDTAGCTTMLDAFFLERLERGGSTAAFERALAVLVDSEGQATTEVIAASATMTPRQVQRLFARHLGYSPRTVARVIRFQKALRSLMVDPRVSLGDIAADAHYYDQAHLVREFRAFTGGVPRGYRGYYPVSGPDDFAPNVVAYVQDDTIDRRAG